MAYAVVDRLAMAVDCLNDAVEVGYTVSIMNRGLISGGGTFAAVRIDDVAAESPFYVGTVAFCEGGTSGHDVPRSVMIAGMAFSILRQQMQGSRVGAYIEGLLLFNAVEDGSQRCFVHRIEGDIYTVVYAVLELLEVTLSLTVGDLHVSIAQSVSGFEPAVQFHCHVH